MSLSLNQAAKAASRSKATLSKDLNSGKLTGTKVDSRWVIDKSELFRCYPPKAKTPVSNTDPEPHLELAEEVAVLRERDKHHQNEVDRLQALLDEKDKRLMLLEGTRDTKLFFGRLFR